MTLNICSNAWKPPIYILDQHEGEQFGWLKSIHQIFLVTCIVWSTRRVARLDPFLFNILGKTNSKSTPKIWWFSKFEISEMPRGLHCQGAKMLVPGWITRSSFFFLNLFFLVKCKKKGSQTSIQWWNLVCWPACFFGHFKVSHFCNVS